MNQSINFLNVNVEGDRHLSRIEKLLDDKKPDVVCFQEVLEKDIPFFIGAGYAHHFVPMKSYYVAEREEFTTEGILTMWNKQFTLVCKHVHSYFTVLGAFEDRKENRAPSTVKYVCTCLQTSVNCSLHIVNIPLVENASVSAI